MKDCIHIRANIVCLFLGEKQTPYEMDSSIGWTWYPAFEEEMHPDVYNARWLGLKPFPWYWRVGFWGFIFLVACLPFFCFYTWGAFELWQDRELIFTPPEEEGEESLLLSLDLDLLS